MIKTKLKQIRVPSSFTLVAGGVSLLLFVGTWLMSDVLRQLDMSRLILAPVLVCATMLAARFPIHLRHNIKLTVTTVPLFLLAVLLPPPAAALATGIAILGVSVLLHARIGSTPLDLLIMVGRWIINGWVSSFVSLLLAERTGLVLLGFIAAALTMFLLEVVGTALEIAPDTGESPQHLIRTIVRQAGFAEWIQYGIGIVGAVVILRELWTVLLLAVPLVVIYYVFKRVKEMQASTRQLLENMADAIDLRDPYTGGHSRRVAEISKHLLYAIPITGPEVELIISAARVHDIGKIRIPDEIIQKPAKLTPAERAIMQTHVQVGADLLQEYKDFARGKEMVLHHHESWDGTGYPSRLKGTEIPLGARVIAVADSFDAMTSDRPYRRAFSADKALQILREGRGTQWDPRIVDTFLAMHAIRRDLPKPVTQPLGEAQQVPS